MLAQSLDIPSLLGLLPAGSSCLAVIVMFVLFARHQRDTLAQVQGMLSAATRAHKEAMDHVTESNRSAYSELSGAINKLSDRLERIGYGGIGPTTR
mgnify:CR=1 FL=1